MIIVKDNSKASKGKKGQKTIKNQTIAQRHLYRKIKDVLGTTEKELPTNTIRRMIGELGREINTWLVENPEGFRMPYEMGVLALSKYILIPFREDRWEIVNKIKNLSEKDISERFKEIILKKYQRELSPGEIHQYMQRGKTVVVPMWFNHRNCSVKKAMCFKWKASADLKRKLKAADQTKYYHWNFNDFYNFKLKCLDEEI